MNTVIITGMSGAGKTQAMNCLEDLGYYCVDNMPPALIENFMELAAGSESASHLEKAAFAIDVRGREMFIDMEKALDDLTAKGIEYKILYLEASERVLIRRFNETRRVHPLSDGGSATQGIRREKEILKALRDRADFVIDTSNMKVARLWQEVKDLITSGESEKTFVVNILTFGYKKGVPLGADMIYDMRFIPNPYYVKSLRPLTGNNKKVRDYVMRQNVTQEFLDRVIPLIDYLIPFYMKEGKYNLNIAFGCTGGHHRSVATANEVAERLKKQGKRVTLEHRDL